MEKTKKVIIAIFCIISILSVDNCRGAEITTEAIAGTEADNKGQNFSYLGIGITRPINDRFSIIGRVFSGYLRYIFKSGDEELAATVPIVTPSIGIRLKRDYLAFTSSIGPDLRMTERETISGGKERDNDAGVSIQGETDIWGHRLKNISIIANYSSIDNFLWGRIRAKNGILEIRNQGHLFAGAELVGMGNKDFSATQIGGFVEISLPSSLSLLLKGGYKQTSEVNSGGYGGIEAYYRF